MERIPFYNLSPQHDPIRQQLREALDNVLATDWFVLGSALSSFEAEFARYHATNFCVGTGNGLDALYLSLRAAGIGPGDEVIVPAHTYIATWLAVSRTGATPVPADVHESTWLLDPKAVRHSLSAKTKAIIPVHLYGCMCAMEDLMAIAKAHTLTVVEDCAQSAGAKLRNQMAGAFGDAGAFSFYPSKNLGALGDGGAVISQSETLTARIRALRHYGQKQRYDSQEQGVNSRLDEMQAAVLQLKLQHLHWWNEQRRQIAAWYQEELSGIDEIILPQIEAGSEAVYHLFPVRAKQRDALQKFLAGCGIETLIHYPLTPFQQQAYQEMHIASGDFTVAETLASSLLSLPIWPGMTPEMVQRITLNVRKFYFKG